MIESGKLKPEEAQNHPQRNIITRALGVGENLNIDFCETTYADDAAILICTDGLTNVVEVDEITSIVHAETGADPVEKLIAAANAGGGIDNVTVVLINK
jgi:protein phosphatase